VIYRCECGESREETLPATGHTYVDGVCGCGAIEEPIEEEFGEMNGLTYALSADGAYYICVGFAAGTRATALIADEYNGKPIKEIAEGAFMGCYALFSVMIGKNITKLGDNAFSQCYNLVEVCNLSVKKISVGSFDNGGVALYAKAVYTSKAYTSGIGRENGYVTYSKGAEKWLIGYEGTSKNLVLPTGITAINQEVFNHCSGLQSVVLPDTVRAIEAEFLGCRTLKSVTIGRGVKSIARKAFRDATALETLTFAVKEGWKTSSGVAVSAAELASPAEAASLLRTGGKYSEDKLIRE
jgi:hypothetical protein